MTGVYGPGLYVEGDEQVNIQHRIEQSGAIPLADADIVLVADKDMTGNISKERVPLVSEGSLSKLVVNILLVVYVP